MFVSCDGSAMPIKSHVKVQYVIVPNAGIDTETCETCLDDYYALEVYVNGVYVGQMTGFCPLDALETVVSGLASLMSIEEKEKRHEIYF